MVVLKTNVHVIETIYLKLKQKHGICHDIWYRNLTFNDDSAKKLGLFKPKLAS